VSVCLYVLILFTLEDHSQTNSDTTEQNIEMTAVPVFFQEMHSSTISTFYQRDTTNSACLFYPLDSPWELELCILYRIYRIIKLNLSMCLFLCSLMYGHSFEHIWTKFGVWQPYTLYLL